MATSPLPRRDLGAFSPLMPASIIRHLEEHDQVIELLQRFQEMGNTARKPVELPHEHTIKLMMVCRSHQRLELRPAFFATGDRGVHILGDDL